MIPFDIMDKTQRKEVTLKMQRVLKSNSILIFPEGSHNYSSNKLVNNLFDGPVNLALQTNRKIVVVTLIKDNENNVSYIDVGNPIDVKDISVDLKREYSSDEEKEKHYVKSLTSVIRDKMSTAVYHMISRHFEVINRNEYSNIEEHFRKVKIEDAFAKLKWERDVFDAEYLVKRTKEEQEYESVVRTISNLTLNSDILMKAGLNNREWVLRALDIENKDVSIQMRNYWLMTKTENVKVKRKK